MIVVVVVQWVVVIITPETIMLDIEASDMMVAVIAVGFTAPEMLVVAVMVPGTVVVEAPVVIVVACHRRRGRSCRGAHRRAS